MDGPFNGEESMKLKTHGVVRWQAAFFFLLVCAGSASANDCLQRKAVGVAVVSEGGRAYFHGDAAICPNRQAYCLQRAYVIARDRVLTSGSQDGYTCAFMASKNATAFGWIESKRLRPEPIDPSPPSSAWEGVWDSEGLMRLKVGHDRHGLKASGVADWFTGGGYDEDGKIPMPNRNHHAEFSGRLHAIDNRARLKDGDCAVDLTLLNAFLIIDDDTSCGDGNTSFSGIYRRKR